MSEKREGDLITIGIVDGADIFRLGLEHALAESQRFRVTGSVASAGALEAHDTMPDVVLLELYLAGARPDFRTVERVAARSRVISMSSRFRPADAITAVRAGAHGIVTKGAGVEDIVDGIDTVVRGGIHLPRELAVEAYTRFGGTPGRGRQDCLSPREQEALGHVALGLTHSQAAARMGVTVNTFNTHIRRIRGKLGVGNKAHLARTAFEFGLAN